MSVFERLQRCVPAHVQPKFTTVAEMRAFHEQEAAKLSREVYEYCQATKVKNVIGRCGIKKKHLNCSFENYYTDCAEQRQAYQVARSLLSEYQKGSARSFVFSGRPGTGKNHLACAIGSGLMVGKKSVVVITVSDLMMQLRNSYQPNPEVTETQIIKHLSQVDLLILDEVGLQRRNNNEAIMLNQIIDNRYIADKPTGVLTNLANNELVECLGERAVERLMENGGQWVPFTWDSYRKAGRKAA
ncbi:ATP-binding protein [Methylophaga sp.]|uniref:ATP-binding protein n=1 Tax=Methylophaga sp. TaxID=2024840 RepID=UPI003A8E51FA